MEVTESKENIIVKIFHRVLRASVRNCLALFLRQSKHETIAIARAFMALKQFALRHKALTNKLKELERKYNRQFKDVYEAINYLLQKDKQEVAQKKRRKIGFKLPKK